MNIVQLKYVVELSKVGSIREASRILSVSQPALSASLKELENEVHLQLFERTNKGIHLTKEGDEFVDFAKRVVDILGDIEKKYIND